MKYKLDFQDLMNHWNEQLEFIQTSIELFDKGKEIEARRIATSLRIMFHNTTRSHSLFKQLNLNHNYFLWSSGGLYTPSNLLSSWVLLELSNVQGNMVYKPILTDVGRTFYLTFEDWWNEVIFDDKTDVFTRKDIITFVANQDGGAHVDKALNKRYSNLVKYNSLGWVDGHGNSVSNNPAYVAIRQIALEVLISQKRYEIGYLGRYKQNDKDFQMRYFDEHSRFKWSTTEIKQSDETRSIVNQYKAEQRKLYIQEYRDKLKVELVLK